MTPDQEAKQTSQTELPKDKARVCQFMLLKFDTEKMQVKVDEVQKVEEEEKKEVIKEEEVKEKSPQK